MPYSVFECQIDTQCQGGFPCKHDLIVDSTTGARKTMEPGELFGLIRAGTCNNSYEGEIALESLLEVPFTITAAELVPLKEKLFQWYTENQVNPLQCNVYWEEETDPRYPGVFQTFEGNENVENHTIHTGFYQSSLSAFLDDAIGYFARRRVCKQLCIIPFATSNFDQDQAWKRDALTITLMRQSITVEEEQQEAALELDHDLVGTQDSVKIRALPTCCLAYSFRQHVPEMDASESTAQTQTSTICTLSIRYSEP